jgi:hypothetical protein
VGPSRSLTVLARGYRPVEALEQLMTCTEKRRLAQEYEAATAKFAEAVRQLQQQIGTSPRSEYERLQRVSDEARVKSEQARRALEQHVAFHDC